MSVKTLKLTPTQQKLMNVFADGLAHRHEQLKLTIDPGGFCSMDNLYNQIKDLRKRLRAETNMDIATVNGSGYALVRKVADF